VAAPVSVDPMSSWLDLPTVAAPRRGGDSMARDRRLVMDK
jgi:hypothetical protein